MSELVIENVPLKEKLAYNEKLYGLGTTRVFLIVSILLSIKLITLILFLGCYLCVVLGIIIGYHRLLTHRSFKCTSGVRILSTCLGCMTYEGAPFFGVAAHRHRLILLLSDLEWVFDITISEDRLQQKRIQKDE